MKTLIPFVAFVTALTFVAPAASFADARPEGKPATAAAYKTGIYSSADGRLNIALDKQTGGSVSIQLKDNRGNVLFSQRVGKHERTCRTRLNLSDLADGTYWIEITNGVNVTRQTVTLATQPPVATGRVVLTETAPTQP